MEFLNFIKNNLGHTFPLVVSAVIAIAIIAERTRMLFMVYPMKNTEAFFEKIREQESDTDELLTSLAESVINPKAEVETEDVSESAKSAAAVRKPGSEDSEAGEDSSSSYSGREGGNGSGNGSMVDDEEVAISSLTDGNNREGDSETGEAMGY